MKAKNGAKNFPVVCVGGSAGGLDAYTRLLGHLPADRGVAIVIVNHLRTVATLLHEILPRHTKMPVELITDKLLIEPNHVFIIPEQRDLHVLDGEFRLKPISKPRGWPDVITIFLRSLTENWAVNLSLSLSLFLKRFFHEIRRKGRIHEANVVESFLRDGVFAWWRRLFAGRAGHRV